MYKESASSENTKLLNSVTNKVNNNGIGCGASDRAEDYSSSVPWFDSQQWYNHWKALDIDISLLSLIISIVKSTCVT